MTTEEVKKTRRKGDRRVEILKAIVALLQTKGQKKITTKILAAHLGLSEAALYRHFSSKSEMYEELLDNAESTLLSFINQIEFSEASGLEQAEAIATSLMMLPKNQPGIVVLLAGDFLATEDERLQMRICTLLDKLRSRLKQALRNAAMQQEIAADYEIDIRSGLLLSATLGHWMLYCRSGKIKPTEEVFAEVRLILR